ncbi:putative CoA-substrate-specific enzyme activase [Natranaerovirga hydrolytica]|uniref:Putative CoA-substrate-specific enzyme activase n=1 Tax=Natranaerovirga hydrolytica TaxID=680378 RepID=A0A4R1MJV4_9FIRM|nr:acyl-CoA dehydratase activase [Natranaerovirga hydrolytica]TCK92735.1 putative CoA-substrate-specific enzyme activase [Natranaerovirga hydrolytica]
MYSIGIDIGYSAIKIVLINLNNEIKYNAYILHKGNINKILESKLVQLQIEYNNSIIYGSVTGQGSKFLERNESIKWVNEVTALVEGSLVLDTKAQSIIEIGGQSAKYITNLSKGKASNLIVSVNANCSAGTGSFIEEQVSRLGITLNEYGEYAQQATFIPRIAGRCSVFAKTDIIHHQQEGVEPEAILKGLAYSLVRNYRGSVMKRNPIKKPIMITGGVSFNTSILDAIKELLKLDEEDMIITDKSGSVTALGAALLALKDQQTIQLNQVINGIKSRNNHSNIDEDIIQHKPLSDFGNLDSVNKHICIDISEEKEVNGYIGVDIGSTSTNVVCINERNEVVAYAYLKTKGKPIEAVSKGLLAIKEAIDKPIKVLGVGTTGSGRQFIGKHIGADIIVDEITAQGKGAIALDKEVDTIIEIGGQDSKFIRLDKGVVKDFEMNKICAAGTGSFIEEQAKKLNIPMEEYGDLALKAENPIDLGDRCTVFIETNIASALSQGSKLEDIAAGLSYSIVNNYLNKVVGKKDIGHKIFFQGGVAYNQGVINAFRSVLEKEVIVPEYFSITGAYGVAVLTQEQMGQETSNFKGFNIDKQMDVRRIEKSKKPKNNHKIKMFQEIEKYYLEGYEAKRDNNKKTIGIPRVLFLHKLFPLFHTYFKTLDYNVVLSDHTNDKTIAFSQEYAMEETCYPIKLINGHIAQLLEAKVDYIFLPSLHTMAHPVSTTRQNYGCVYMQSYPKLIEETMNLKEKEVELLSPALSFQFGKKHMMKTLMALGNGLGRTKVETTLALTKGMKQFKAFEQKVEKLGEAVVNGLKKDEKAFVIITRAYGITDPILNMGIPEKIEKLGYKVLTLSNLPAHDHDTSKEHPNMYWPFGQHILSGAQIVKQNPNLYPIYITNHGCGPDTILNHYFKEEMKDKPYLNIEVDEHFSDVGVLTRIEAFINSLKSETIKEASQKNLKAYAKQVNHKEVNIDYHIKDFNKEYTYNIPYLYPYANFLESYLKFKGYKANTLPMTSQKTIELGRKYTLSKEYFSLTALLGDVMNQKHTLEKGKEKQSFILPTSEGAEANGQYHRLIRDKLDQEGLNTVKIVSPFIEDIIKDEQLSKAIFLMLLAGDLIYLLPRNKRSKYAKIIQQAILDGTLSIENIKVFAQSIKLELNGDEKKKLLIIGEPSIVYNDFMNNFSFQSLEEKGIQLEYAPFSEYILFLWKDKEYSPVWLKDLEQYRKDISTILNERQRIPTVTKSFESNIDTLQTRANQCIGLYEGGNGRYRISKALETYEHINGIFTVASMYENTNTILNSLTQDKKSQTVPTLNLIFDGNANEIDQSKIDAFIYYHLSTQ